MKIVRVIFPCLLLPLLVLSLGQVKGQTAVEHLTAAEGFYQSDLFEKALSEVNKAVAKDPELENAWDLKGFIHFKTEEYREAVSAWNKAKKLNAKEGRYWMLTGVARIRLEDDEAACADAHEAIKLGFDTPKVQEVIDFACGRTEGDEAKDSDFQTDEEKAVFLYNQGRKAYASGDFQTSFDLNDQAIGLKSDFAEAYCNRGLARARLGDEPGCLTDMQKANELKPNDPMILGNLGETHLKLGQEAEAIPFFQKAIELDGKNAGHHLGLGQCLNQTGAVSEAETHITRALVLDPKFTDARFMRAVVRDKLDNFEGALQDLNAVIQQRPGEGMYFTLRGFVKCRMGDCEAGCQDMAKGKEMGDLQAEKIMAGYCD